MNNIIQILEGLGSADLNTLAQFYGVQANVNKISDCISMRAHLPNTEFIIPNIESVYGTKDKRIAEGTYGEVWSTDKNFAIKIIKDNSIESDENTLREVSILRYIDHPCVLKLYGIQLTPTIIAMPKALGTMNDYSDLLHDDINARKRAYYQLLNAVAYLHSKYIWHLDIKEYNVLVFSTDPMSIKLADFGISQPYAIPRTGNNMNVVTLWWRAPELLANDKLYTSAVDLWSIGVMLYTNITGKVFHGTQNDEIGQLKYINSLLGVPEPHEWNNFSKLSSKYFTNKNYTFEPEVSEFEEYELLRCLLTWPDVRCSAIDALGFPYFDSVRDMEMPIIPVQTCGDMLALEETMPTLPLRITIDERRAVLDSLDKFVRVQRMRAASLFYGIALFDRIINKLPDVKPLNLGYACTVIGSYLYELWPPELSEYSFTGKSDEFKELIKTVLIITQFNLIFPSASEFMIAYTFPKHDSIDPYKTLYRIVRFSPDISPSNAAKYALTYTNNYTCLKGKVVLPRDLEEYLATF